MIKLVNVFTLDCDNDLWRNDFFERIRIKSECWSPNTSINGSDEGQDKTFARVAMDHIRSWLLALPIGLIIAVPGSVAQTQQQVDQAVEAHFGDSTPPGKVLLWKPGYPGGAAMVVQAGSLTVSFVFGCAVGTEPAKTPPA